MEIEPNRLAPRPLKPTGKHKAQDAAGAASASAHSVDAFKGKALPDIEAALRGMPELREERLGEGRLLAEDPNYPTADDLRALAERVLRSGPDAASEE